MNKSNKLRSREKRGAFLGPYGSHIIVAYSSSLKDRQTAGKLIDPDRNFNNELESYTQKCIDEYH